MFKQTMKNPSILKVLAVAVMIGLTASFGFAGTVTISPSGAATNSVLSATAGQITSATFTAGGSAATIRLFDAPSTALTYSVGAYTNYTPTVYTNTTANYTDILGNAVTNSYKYITNIATTVNAATPSFRTIGVYVIPANETVTINYDTVNPFTLGVLATNNAACTITLQYQPWK